MARVADRDEERILQKFRDLSPERKQEVIDFLDFLTAAVKAKEWLEFDRLCKSRRGFCTGPRTSF
jgi:hypothetical protein